MSGRGQVLRHIAELQISSASPNSPVPDRPWLNATACAAGFSRERFGSHDGDIRSRVARSSRHEASSSLSRGPFPPHATGEAPFAQRNRTRFVAVLAVNARNEIAMNWVKRQ